ncbi:MAG: HAD family phosphatase [Planctomycetota bacterium]|nr:HAD family phosphatase [Planctomycetota bacterium]
MSDQEAVIFDLDGVLVDSSQAHFESWQLLCQERGWAMSRAQFDTTFGRTSREIIREFWGPAVRGDGEVAEVDDRKEAIFRELLAREFPAIDGGVELIDHLRAAGFVLAIGSSAPPDNVALALDCLQRRDAFGAIVTADDVQRGKPDPQVYRLAAQRLSVRPAKAVVIEDAPVGVMAAHAAGLKCIGLASTAQSRAQLAAADLVVSRLRELDATVIRRVLLGSPGEVVKKS